MVNNCRRRMFRVRVKMTFQRIRESLRNFGFESLTTSQEMEVVFGVIMNVVHHDVEDVGELG